MDPGPNIIKLFWHNYVAVGTSSVKSLLKYAASSVIYAQKSFISLATELYQHYIFFVTNKWALWANEFVPGKPFQPSLLFGVTTGANHRME
jgi:hypothetical protein